jgi:hypothetical protein
MCRIAVDAFGKCVYILTFCSALDVYQLEIVRKPARQSVLYKTVVVTVQFGIT